MNKLRPRILCTLAGIGISLVAGSAQALNGNTVLITCATCETPVDFRNAAVSANNLVDKSAVTYAVLGSSSAGMSAYVYVSGYWIVDPLDYSQAWWNVDTAVTMDESGATLSADIPTAQAQMSVVDVGLFGYSRNSGSPNVATVKMPADSDGSFIGSTDEFDSPGIGYALGLLNVNPALFKVGAKLLVMYPDGSKAVFVKVSNTSSYQWAWDVKHAWNAQGKPIDRAGNVKTNSNTSGTGSGSVTISETLDGAGNAAALWFIYQYQQCTTWTTVTVNGDVSAPFYSFVPC